MKNITCNVSPEMATRFDVTLRDGRVFLGCGIHGSGGTLHGDAHAMLRRALSMLVRRTSLRIYTTARAAGDEWTDVTAGGIESIRLAVA